MRHIYIEFRMHGGTASRQSLCWLCTASSALAARWTSRRTASSALASMVQARASLCN